MPYCTAQSLLQEQGAHSPSCPESRLLTAQWSPSRPQSLVCRTASSPATDATRQGKDLVSWPSGVSERRDAPKPLWQQHLLAPASSALLQMVLLNALPSKPPGCESISCLIPLTSDLFHFTDAPTFPRCPPWRRSGDPHVSLLQRC